MSAATAPVPIVALDVPDLAGARRLVAALGDTCRFYKVGSELFTAEGPAVLRWLRDEQGCDVFLDLKFHDIPATMAGGARSAAALGARLLTVHASAGVDGVRAAVDGAGEGCGVLAVTVLTSFSATAIGAVWGRAQLTLEAEVLRLADLAAEAGTHGLVCSGHEAAAVRERHGDRLAPLVPGIRLAGGATHDQARVMTPDAAAAAGARYLVLGRAVTAAPDPAAAMRLVHRALAPSPAR